MAKRDYYEVLGVGKDASADQIKSAYRKKQLNIILIKTKVIRLLKINLKKHQKLITYYLTLRENKITIILATLLLKMEVEEEVVLAILIFQVIFQIFLKIFLAKDLVEEEDQEDQTIEDLI